MKLDENVENICDKCKMNVADIITKDDLRQMEKKIKIHIDKFVVCRLANQDTEINEIKGFIMQKQFSKEQLKDIMTFSQFKESASIKYHS